MAQDEQRRQQGREMMARLRPRTAAATLATLEGMAPPMADFLLEFAMGAVLARPGLDLPTRELATVAALAALGNAESQLRWHLAAALNVGVTARRLMEAMYLIAVFAGFPAALNGLAACREVFAQKGVEPEPAAPLGGEERERGLAALEATSGPAGREVVEAMAKTAPAMAEFLIRFSYGQVICRPALAPAEKEVVMMAAAAARGTMRPQLQVHVAAALNVGMSREAIMEVLYQMTVYAGFPAALNAIAAAQEVFAERDAG